MKLLPLIVLIIALLFAIPATVHAQCSGGSCGLRGAARVRLAQRPLGVRAAFAQRPRLQGPKRFAIGWRFGDRS